MVGVKTSKCARAQLAEKLDLSESLYNVTPAFLTVIIEVACVVTWLIEIRSSHFDK